MHKPQSQRSQGRLPELPFDSVAIGAAVGGLTAWSQVLAPLPADFPVPIVMAHHLNPVRPSLLATILRSRAPGGQAGGARRAPTGALCLRGAPRPASAGHCRPYLLSLRGRKGAVRKSLALTRVKVRQRGMPIEQIQKFVGHAKLETTQGYAESTPAMIKESYRRALAE